MATEFSYVNKIKTFNKEQCLSANCFEGPLLILAGPGSGKSTVLKVRAALMIMGQKIVQNKNNQNVLVTKGEKVAPENILLVTFTNKAASELEEDMKSYLNEELGTKINVGTFHSLASRILKENYLEFGISQHLKIIQGEEQIKIIKLVNYYSQQNPSDIISQIGMWKNEMYIGNDAYAILHQKYIDNPQKLQILRVYQAYEEYKQKRNLWDTDDLIPQAIKFLSNKKFTHILQKYHELFKYICLDEYQDTNASQYEFSMLLKNSQNNICVVGDPDQSIYEWRGADMSIIKRFTSEFNNSTEVLLLQNYRSQATIIEAADFILQNNNIDKKPRGSIEQGKIINRQRENLTHVLVNDNHEEARYILREIRNLKKQNIKLKDMAIFARSISQVKIIEEMINLDNEICDKKMAYNISTTANFYKNKDIDFVWQLLLLSLNPHQNNAIIKILKLLKITPDVIEKLEKYSILNDISIFSLLLNIKSYYSLENDYRYLMLVNIIKDLIRYAAQIQNNLSKIITKIRFDLLELNYSENKELFKYYNFYINISNIKLLQKFINNLENLSPDNELFINKDNFIQMNEVIQNYSIEFEPNQDYLNIMTMHASKGLEFEVVFCCGLIEGQFPSKRAVTNIHIEAERRLAFVAYTRAKQKLYLTSTKYEISFGKKKPAIISRFITEITEEIKQINANNNYQKIMENFVQKNLKGEILNTVLFNSLPDTSWQENISVGSVVFHTHLKKEGVITKNSKSYLYIDFDDKNLKIFKNNSNLILKGV